MDLAHASRFGPDGFLAQRPRRRYPKAVPYERTPAHREAVARCPGAVPAPYEAILSDGTARLVDALDEIEAQARADAMLSGYVGDYSRLLYRAWVAVGRPVRRCEETKGNRDVG